MKEPVIINGRICKRCMQDKTLEQTGEVSPVSLDSCSNLNTYNWLQDIPDTARSFDIVEVKFKNTRKGFYRNVHQLRLKKGDIVAVEASPGHDIGIVSLVGELVALQMKKYRVDPEDENMKKIYRRAKEADLQKWKEAIRLEHSTMIKARKIAADLNLDMKIGDVEYQGDKTKAIFYYIADERVDFRELIKVLAEEFRIRIEMRQIGVRQEAGRIGGIGPCGRELCCSTWIANFVSVTTGAARQQELSLNPQKLAGQCGKLKCCLNYELECYLDATRDFPDGSIVLETEEGPLYHQKTDVFSRMMWYSTEKESAGRQVCLSVDRVNEIIAMNRKGIPVKKIIEEVVNIGVAPGQTGNDLHNDDPERFSKNRKKKGGSRKRGKNRPNRKEKRNS